MSTPQSGAVRPQYAERLVVPTSWWLLALLFLGSLLLAFLVAIPALVAWGAFAVLAGLTAVLFVGWGSARVLVADGQLRADPAHIDARHLARPEALDRTRTRALLGVEADARAFLLVRPYLPQSVRVEVTDPADPTPYWLVSTRRPAALVAALEAAIAAAGGPADGRNHEVPHQD